LDSLFVDQFGNPLYQRPAEPFTVYTSTELHALRGQTRWILKRTIPHKSVGSIYGPSRSGKTFISIDLLAHLTRDGFWYGRKVHRRWTIYMPYEGVGSIPDRDLAWERHHGAPTGIHYITERVNLRDAYQRTLMIEMFKARGWFGAVFCIDTLAQAFAGIEENSSEMAEVLKVAQEISDALNATVVIVHHSGHSAQDRPRGWSGFFAGLDFAIACNIPEGADKHDRTFTLAKVKDGEDGIEFGFTLKAKVLDEQPDEDGDWSTSLVALPRELKKGKTKDEAKEAPDPVRDAEDDNFLVGWIKKEREAHNFPSKRSVESELAEIKKAYTITGARIRASIERLLGDGRLAVGSAKDSPFNNTFLYIPQPL